jgi:organic radical activating enzyme
MRVTEVFESVQGEGKNAGKPSMFVRLSGCNLRCKFCDTKYSYDTKHTMSNDDLYLLIRKYRTKNIVWTGGEPSLQMEGITDIIESLGRTYTNEIETNGTKYFDPAPFDLVTVSPKMGHVNMEVLKDFNCHMSYHKKVVFKFVCSNVKEFWYWKDMCESLNIPKNNVYMMPEGTTSKRIIARSKWLIPLCMKTGFNYSPRLQTIIFGKRRGV